MNNIAEIRPPHIHIHINTSNERNFFRERCISTRDPTCDVKEILHELNELHPTWEIGAKEGRCAIRSG